MVPSRFFLRGVYYNLETFHAIMSSDSFGLPLPIHLVQVNDNEHDLQAIRAEIEVGGERTAVGWVPREVAPYLRKIMPAEEMESRIISASLSTENGCFVEVEVYLPNYLPRQGRYYE